MLAITDAVKDLDRDLRQLFGARLKSVVAYGSLGGAEAPASTLAIVDTLTGEDLRACAARMPTWGDAGLATPILVAADEFGRSLDAFPFEFGGIMADHVLVSGTDPFSGLQVDPDDLRRACEIQARSHLLHLREGYLETEGRSDAIADLLARSSGALAALLRSVSRLVGGPSATLEDAARHVEERIGVGPGSLGAVARHADGQPLAPSSGRELFPAYLDGVTRLVNYVDRWTVN